jgi:hypothetical protein
MWYLVFSWHNPLSSAYQISQKWEPIASVEKKDAEVEAKNRWIEIVRSGVYDSQAHSVRFPRNPLLVFVDKLPGV